MFCLFAKDALFTLLADLLTLINSPEFSEGSNFADGDHITFNYQYLQDRNKGTIRSEFSQSDIKYGLKYICDFDRRHETYQLSLQKVQKALALSVLHEKQGGYTLSEF